MSYVKLWRIPMLKTFFLSICLLGTLSCSDDDDDAVDGNWTKIATPSTSIRGGAVSFVLNNKGYFGLGYNGSPSGSSTAKGYKADFWSFNGSVWQDDIPAFPGIPREQAVAFVLNNKAYVGLGYNDDRQETLRDFWEYDPATNAWDSIGAFPIALVNAVAFVVDNRAFVGTGKKSDDSWENRFWEFNGTGRSWATSPYTTIPGDLREGAFAFTIGNTAYIGGGFSNNSYYKDMYIFKPSADAGMQGYTLNNNDDGSYYDEFAAAVGKANAITFVQDGFAYIATGGSPSALSSVYQYNPADESWHAMTGFEGSARTHAVGFVCNNRMILGTGNNGTSYFNDFWEFKPYEEYDDLN